MAGAATVSYSKELVVLELAPGEDRRRPLTHAFARLLSVGLIAALASLTTAPDRTDPGPRGHIALASSPGMFVIDVAPVMVAEPLKETPLPIQLVPADLVPHGGWLKIAGLPELASLSDGYATAPGAWRVPATSLPTLKVIAPAGGRGEIVIALTSADGIELARARSVLLVDTASLVGSRTEKRGVLAVTSVAGRDSAAASSKEEARRRAQNLVRRGDDSMAEGDVASARAFYERAVRLGSSQAAMALGATYDPNDARHRWGSGSADPAAARDWYAKARELAQAEAAEIDFYLARLESKAP